MRKFKDLSTYSKLTYLSKFPVQVIIKKLLNHLRNKIKLSRYKKLVYSNDLRRQLSNKSINPVLPIIDTKPFDSNLITSFLKKEFNILGSGPVSVGYTHTKPKVSDTHYFDSAGLWLNQFILPQHLDFSLKIWEKILELNELYTPIDWQKDHKSSYHWSSKKWFKEQSVANSNSQGVDIKVPWELSRLQHLPVLALAANQEKNVLFANETICQILDFIMANPIAMGVNFNCPMDIGIRNANILLAINWLKNGHFNTLFTNEIEEIVANYIEQSTQHILIDIEYREGLTSNHYLGNVLGVLYAGAYLKDSTYSEKWLAFGIQELERSMERQFFKDGTNFEGSTSYHRLSAEMMAWGAILVLALPKERISNLNKIDSSDWPHHAPLILSKIKLAAKNKYVLSDAFWKKLIKAAMFSKRISKSNGEIPQFGDNDSGRFVRITTFGKWKSSNDAVSFYKNLANNTILKDTNYLYYDESHLNHGAFISSIHGLLNNQLPISKVHFARFEYDLFNQVSSQVEGLQSYLSQLYENLESSCLLVNSNPKIDLEFKSSKTFDFSNKDLDLNKDMEIQYYPDFQLALFQNKNLHLAIAGISNPNFHHSLGHTHNDKLSVELTINGKNILFNPGTYVYSANPEMRYAFRSVCAHNTISVNNQEQNRPLGGSFGLFNLRAETTFELLHLTNSRFVGKISYRDIVHIREIIIQKKSITINDFCNKEFKNHWNTGEIYSNGYGQLICYEK